MTRRNLLASVLMAFLLVAGIGVASSYMGGPSTGAGHAKSDGETLANLKAYTRSIKTGETPKAAAGKHLPDVNTMIERLAARLQTAPEDIKGWRMLGWSYFHTGRYAEAAAAYARAVSLDPNSAELKSSYEEAKTKASQPTSSLQTEAVREGGDELHVANTETEAVSPPKYDAAIRSMVDGLADRLKQSPQDVEGWTRLMRSRVVLGEREAAETAFRNAREIFKDDSDASRKIAATATELGLKDE